MDFGTWTHNQYMRGVVEDDLQKISGTLHFFVRFKIFVISAADV